MDDLTRLNVNVSTRSNASVHVPAGLIFGDLVTLALVTALGFASHQTLLTAGPRIAATFFPLLIGWAASAPVLGAYQRAYRTDLRQLWRPVWAMVLAAPLAAVLRGFWLQSAVVPVFAAVMAAVGVAAIAVWRMAYILLSRRAAQDPKSHG